MRKFKMTLDSTHPDMLEISSDYGITDGVYVVEVSDPEDGAEIYKEVEKNYSKWLPMKEWNFVTHHFISSNDVTIEEI